MKIAIKKSDTDKIIIDEIETLFGAIMVDELEYNPPKLAKTLNENIFEFNHKHKDTFLEYLKQRFITGRVLKGQ